MARINIGGGSMPSINTATGISKSVSPKMLEKPIAILLYLNGASIYVTNPPHKKVLKFPVLLHSKIKQLLEEMQKRNPELIEMILFPITNVDIPSPADTVIDYADF